eukprot:CAMPEP_0184487186 /NCGR_PEP_ID=MMETSP0113_2-20130426/9432_1 /TAXON_ID=91329 /ORGANISM="Norrisiella sphaerica, Strain BC52" /LENGTH=280 /DNA_ID=CAMNT_0026869387 /DNA_START=125 /DNA_END=967 /DNA_ORIENTATION=+
MIGIALGFTIPAIIIGSTADGLNWAAVTLTNTNGEITPTQILSCEIDYDFGLFEYKVDNGCLDIKKQARLASDECKKDFQGENSDICQKCYDAGAAAVFMGTLAVTFSILAAVVLYMKYAKDKAGLFWWDLLSFAAFASTLICGTICWTVYYNPCLKEMQAWTNEFPQNTEKATVAPGGAWALFFVSSLFVLIGTILQAIPVIFCKRGGQPMNKLHTEGSDVEMAPKSVVTCTNPLEAKDGGSLCNDQSVIEKMDDSKATTQARSPQEHLSRAEEGSSHL